MKKLKKIGIVAMAAASFALSTSAFAAAHHAANTKDVKCYGVNTCKGKGSCKTAANACKGKNTCKGKGVVMVSKSACDQLGGTVMTASAKAAPKMSNAAAPAAQANTAAQTTSTNTAAVTTTTDQN